jgi:nicotinamidase-related amidase
VRSTPINEPGKFLFRVGTVPVTLVDGDTGEALAKRKLIAYRLGTDDRKHWFRSSYTDETGTVRFDLPGVGDGERYVIKAINPFGDNQYFYSDPISQEGAVRFAVLADADRVRPQTSIESPAQGMEVGAADLAVRGTASDDEALAAVQPVDGEVVVGKHRVNALFGTDLDMILRANEIETIIMLGDATSGVVLSTTRYAADSDYRIVIVEDCCVDTDAEVHDFFMQKIFPCQADVLGSADVIRALK